MSRIRHHLPSFVALLIAFSTLEVSDLRGTLMMSAMCCTLAPFIGLCQISLTQPPLSGRLTLMSMSNQQYDRLISARDVILKAQAKAPSRRKDMMNWFENEMRIVLEAANSWALKNHGTVITYEDVLRMDQHAYGHSDWASKLALYVAELVVGV